MISAIVIDTTVASMLHPRKKDQPFRDWYERRLRDKTPVLSFQSVAELWSWAVENQWSRQKRQRLEQYIRRFLVIPYDTALAKAWAMVTTHCRQQGRRLEAGDAWIVATAVQRRLPLLSHDADHSLFQDSESFRRYRLRINRRRRLPQSAKLAFPRRAWERG
jgi:predicted nucleic acid-binding protein